MKRLSILAILLCAPPTFAESKPGKEAAASPAESLVQRTLVRPLASKERESSRFSRKAMPAQARRVRILDEQKDVRGATFVRFAVDARHGYKNAADEASWRKDSITGCVYLERGEVFVKKGDEYRPAAFLLGKNLKAAAAPTCHAASEVAQAD